MPMKKELFVISFALLFSLLGFSQSRQPYANYYGYNSACDTYGCSAIRVTAPKDADLVVLIKKSNKVVAHAYTSKNNTLKLEIPDGTYNIFFYCGNNWNSSKAMNSVKGGFTDDESFLKDTDLTLNNQIMSYVLQSTYNGNFSAEKSNKNDMFE